MALLRVKEVADRLGIHRVTVYNLAREGLLPSVRIGAAVRFDPLALQKFIDAGGTAVSPTVPPAAAPRA